LVWLTFPRAKAALNARHLREMEHEAAGRRGRVRDALTQFDEDGIIVLCSQPELLELIRTFQWRQLFWGPARRRNAECALLVFGHAPYDSY
jgi:hypothetical protein